jgi:hypothetical protein
MVIWFSLWSFWYIFPVLLLQGKSVETGFFHSAASLVKLRAKKVTKIVGDTSK